MVMLYDFSTLHSPHTLLWKILIENGKYFIKMMERSICLKPIAQLVSKIKYGFWVYSLHH